MSVMNPKISVVVPVYNVENYLEACVDSVLRQTFQDFEIILIDDGSTDGSGKICDLLDNHTKISVIHKKNGGLSHTRNVGTMAATGEYITYLDSDDTIASNYLQVMLSLIEEYDADMSSCEFYFCKEAEKVELRREYVNGVLNGKDALKKMLIGNIHGTSACGLLIKSELAKKNEFPVGKFHEDDLTTYKYFMHAARVAYTKEPLYNYYQRPGSIMHKDFSVIDIDELDAADKIYEDCKELGMEYEATAMVKKLNNYLQVLFKFDDLSIINPVACNRIDTFLKTECNSLLKNNYIRKKSKLIVILNFVGILWMIRKIYRKIF